MWRSTAIALLSFLLALLPVVARAAPELTSLVLKVETKATNHVDTAFQVTVTVTGTDIASAKITPAGGIEIPLTTCISTTSCSATQSLTKAELDALLPVTAKNYTIVLTGTTPPTPAPTVTDTFSFARPDASLPSISAPGNDLTIDPGPLEVKFGACTVTAVTATTPATCTATQGVLEKGTAEIETKTDLPASETSWKPTIPLTEQSAYTVRITHTAGGQSSTAGGKPLTTSVTHSDQVAFSTGFAAPMGTFCIVVNDTNHTDDKLEPSGCTVVTEPAAGILDTSDCYVTTADGIPIQYGLQLAASGKLTGIADADLDLDNTYETHAEVVGKLRGKEGLLRQKLRVRFAPTSETRFHLRIREQADIATLQEGLVPSLEWLVAQTTRGKVAGAKLSESMTTVRTQPGIPCVGETPHTALTGWKLSFSLTGTSGPTSGTLQLANDDDDVPVALVAKQSFDSGSNQSDLKLESEGAERGVRIRVKRLEIDATTLPKRITAGAVRFRAFGQGGSLILPTLTTTTTTAPPTTTTTSTTSTTTSTTDTTTTTTSTTSTTMGG